MPYPLRRPLQTDTVAKLLSACTARFRCFLPCKTHFQAPECPSQICRRFIGELVVSRTWTGLYFQLLILVEYGHRIFWCRMRLDCLKPYGISLPMQAYSL